MNAIAALHARTDWVFFRRLFLIAMPIALQTMMFSSRSLVDIMMLGQLGEIDVAAVGIAGKALFVATLLVFGITTGGSMLTAQYWGAGNIRGFRQKTALTVVMTCGMALIGAACFLFFAEDIMRLATDVPEVVVLGALYLKITGFSLINAALGSSLAAPLRAMHKPGISTFFSAVGIGLNIVLNWVLIFGHLGMPAMGIEGAAWATLISGLVEVVLLYGYLYAKKHICAFSLDDLVTSLEWGEVKRFLSLSLPTAANYLLWSGGLFVYHAIIGQLGVQGLAALSVITPLESFALSLLIGFANAAAVLVGNQLGAANMEEAYNQAWLVTIFNIGCGVFTAIVLLLSQDLILSLFSSLSVETLELTKRFYWVLAGLVIVKTVPLTLIVGVLRAGGDIRYCLYQDITAQWCIGIPVVALGALHRQDL